MAAAFGMRVTIGDPGFWSQAQQSFMRTGFASVSQHAQKLDIVVLEKRQHTVIEQIGVGVLRS
jgi:hypothetical protein